MGDLSHVFRLHCDTEPGEVLAVTGSSPDLGAWKKPAVLPMVQDSQDRSVPQVRSGQAHLVLQESLATVSRPVYCGGSPVQILCGCYTAGIG